MANKTSKNDTVEFKLPTMIFDTGTEFTFYNDTSRIFILVKGNGFFYKDGYYETNMMHTKWNVEKDILSKIGYTDVNLLGGYHNE
jgi:hypothetical protein